MTTIGNDLIGGATTNVRLNFRIHVRAALPDTNGGTIDRVEFYNGGNGANGSGTVLMRGIVYRDVCLRGIRSPIEITTHYEQPAQPGSLAAIP